MVLTAKQMFYKSERIFNMKKKYYKITITFCVVGGGNFPEISKVITDL